MWALTSVVNRGPKGSRVARSALLALVLCLAAAAAAPTVVAGRRNGSPRLTILAFSGSAPRDARTIPRDAVKPGGTYGSCRLNDLKALYASVSFSGMRDGTATEVRWLLGRRVMYTLRFHWDSHATGRDVYFVERKAKDREIEDGRWKLDVLYGGSVLSSASVTRVTEYC